MLGCTLGLDGSPYRAGLAATHTAFVEQNSDISLIPYVQDGLVAMWDGVWNVGYDMHDNGSEIWTDLTGNGNDAVIFKSEAYVKDEPFDGIAARMDGTFSFRFVPSSELVSALQGSCTVEILCALGVYPEVDSTPYISVGGYSMSIMSIRGIADTGKARPFINKEIHFSGGADNHRPFLSRAFVKQMDGTTATCSWYKRGVYDKGETCAFQAGSSSTGYLFGAAGNQFFMGKGMWWDSGEDGYAYGMRVYDRALSADEIEYNYSIDAGRFWWT